MLEQVMYRTTARTLMSNKWFTANAVQIMLYRRSSTEAIVQKTVYQKCYAGHGVLRMVYGKWPGNAVHKRHAVQEKGVQKNAVQNMLQRTPVQGIQTSRIQKNVIQQKFAGPLALGPVRSKLAAVWGCAERLAPQCGV